MTAYFSDWLTRVLTSIIDQTNSNTTLIAAIQATQAQIVAVQAQLVAVQQAQNPASGKFGNAAATVSAAGATWTPGPVVNLTGVSAGNLTFPGSGPNQIDATDVNPSGPIGDFTGHWRLVEIVGAVETVVFTGDYAASRMRDDGSSPFASILYNTSNTSGSIAATSTGAVSYRLDIQAVGFAVNAVQLALYCNRA
jgi:hypothetical protein